MSAITATEWEGILRQLGVKPVVALDWRDAFADEVQPEKFSAGEADIVDWLPQILHECVMLTVLEERLSYSADRLMKVWPSRFGTYDRASLYANKPHNLAEHVYGGRMGNGPQGSGDGWRYRGRGPIQLTGRDGYAHVGDLIGQDLTATPELMVQKRYGLEASIAWWEDRIPDSMLSDQVRLRKRVNGGTVGLEHVAGLAQLTREVFA
jgi:putative chitinase